MALGERKIGEKRGVKLTATLIESPWAMKTGEQNSRTSIHNKITLKIVFFSVLKFAKKTKFEGMHGLLPESY